MDKDEQYMHRCLELAKNGFGRTYPNPMVGAVIVHKNQIVGEGWHQQAGKAHAEVNAINAVKNKEILGQATIYVSLEPCSHFGRTTPCADLIIASGIKKVVIGCVDPYESVAGKGIKKLLDAGCKVKVGVLEKLCLILNQRFFTYHNKKRPFIILKWAQSKDGFLGPLPQNAVPGRPRLISGIHSRQFVHKWRSEEQSIMVGTNTAILDNPKLNTRSWKGPSPIRIVLDRNHRIPMSSHLFHGDSKTILITQSAPKIDYSENVCIEQISSWKELPPQIGNILYQHGLQSVIIEGGSMLLKSFIQSGHWDEARIFIGNSNLFEGIKAPEITGKVIDQKQIDHDHLMIYTND